MAAATHVHMRVYWFNMSKNTGSGVGIRKAGSALIREAGASSLHNLCCSLYPDPTLRAGEGCCKIPGWNNAIGAFIRGMIRLEKYHAGNIQLQDPKTGSNLQSACAWQNLKCFIQSCTRSSILGVCFHIACLCSCNPIHCLNWYFAGFPVFLLCNAETWHKDSTGSIATMRLRNCRRAERMSR